MMECMSKEAMMLDPVIYEFCRSDVDNIGGFDKCEFIDADEGYFKMRAYPQPNSANNIGTVHGGYLLAIADMAGTGAADTYGWRTTTMQTSANFISAGRLDDEYLDVVAKAIHKGRRTAVTEVEITRPDGKLIMKALFTIAILEARIGE